MTRILAIDSSTTQCAVACAVAGRVWIQSSPRAHAHAQDVLALVQSVIDQAQTSLDALDALAVVAGPGSFTGVRIAVGVAQGLALALDQRVITLSSLEVLAATALHHHSGDGVIVSLEASDGEVYCAVYGRGSGLAPVLLGAEQVVSHSQRDSVLRAPRKGHWLGVGDGWHACPFDTDMQQAGFTCIESLAPDMDVVCSLARLRWQQGAAVEALDVAPNYLKEHLGYRTA